jgi:hypothetical protein
MIRSITAGQGLVVDHSQSYIPYISPTNANSNPLHGMMRINGNDIQVFDGTLWQTVSGVYPSISLNASAQAAIVWVQSKMAEEESIKKLAEKHPAVADAMNTINEAYDKLKVIVALTNEEGQENA